MQCLGCSSPDEPGSCLGLPDSATTLPCLPASLTCPARHLPVPFPPDVVVQPAIYALPACPHRRLPACLHPTFLPAIYLHHTSTFRTPTLRTYRTYAPRDAPLNYRYGA